MADGFIVRRGGKAEEVLRTATPDINFVSKTQTQIVVTFKNNDAAEAEIYYGLTAPLTDTVTLATGATSSNITFSGLAANTQFTVSAYALVTDPTTKKIKSEVVSTQITTDALIYTAATGGTTEEYDDSGKRYKSHTFTSDGNFIVTTVGDATDDRNKVDFLVIAGGAGGGAHYAGGGGAGGYQTSLGTSGADSSALSKITVTAKTYGITIGAGGNGGNYINATSDESGSNGTNSVFDTITSTGGGGGASRSTGTPSNAKVGGSGGGGGNDTTSTSGAAGTTNQGRAGGNGLNSGGNSSGGGGGGAFAVGSNGTSATGGAGGNGLGNVLRTGSSETRTGGGGGGASTGASGGSGGAGSGGNNGQSGANATANTGSGGGGAGSAGGALANTGIKGGNGAAGIVVIRYEIAPSV
jgi:hypothetical protein